MNNRFSTNGDGEKSSPNDVSRSMDGQKPAHPDSPNHENEQHVIKALRGRYDEIEALWNEAEEDLKRFRIPQDVEHCYETENRCHPCIHYLLGFVRYGKGWRICHGECDDNYRDEPAWKPIIECPLDVRLKMISYFQNLRKKVIEAAEDAIPKLDKAISSFRKVLKD
jgi:hypothetical protein